MKFLVAEDTKSNLMFLSACIRELGHEVIAASNNIEALEIFEQRCPDLVLLDVIMPEMDGITTAHEIRTRTTSRHQWVPIIFISAMGDDKDVVKGLEVSGDDYLRREWKRSIRSASPLTLFLLDVDHFKLFNDNYGHTVGDEALIKVAECLGKNVRRPGDLVARYGGEEFALILPETDSVGGSVIMERVRSAIEDLGIRYEFSSTAQSVTISLGSMNIIPSKNEQPGNANRLSASR